ncbi:dioxygenase [Novosphingobium humi]|uniref:Dioxygenase n=1 Tax=Novosphingobium humi TaxID=2282397 RepID=A0ABY7U4F5_9SPHN|nr:dioxygenase [Novosphingobium humi]WCT79239.1 dioxygenase [Novosphingobium humi]
MTKPDFAAITEATIDRMAEAPNARLREILTIGLRHLHDAIRETRLTETEWDAAIAFLTRTGQMCTAERQEFILLSDVLGVSMLVDALNHAGGEGVSESTVFGPFYAGRQPLLAAGASILKRPEEGTPLHLRGTVSSALGLPIAGALVEVWQTAPNGLYDVQDQEQPVGHLRASFETAADGSFAFETILPVSYAIPDDGTVGALLKALGRHPNRPAHIHFMITAGGFRRLVTHLFIDGDPYLESDAVFGVKSSLIVQPQALADGSLAVEYPFTLADAWAGLDG